MHLCAQEDHVNVAEILCKYNAAIDPPTKAGYTPLHTASHFGQINMVKFLLERDAEVDAQTRVRSFESNEAQYYQDQSDFWIWYIIKAFHRHLNWHTCI